MDLHMARLMKSANHFSFRCDIDNIRRVLQDHSSSFNPSLKYKTRLVVGFSGNTDIRSQKIVPDTNSLLRITFSQKKTDRHDSFLSHKTTRRELYDMELASYREKGYFDILFTNKEDEVTEGAITNIIIQKDGRYLTPPLSSGVLPGTYREYLIKSGEIPLEESILLREDILRAEKVFLINSVIKLREACF